MTNKNEGYRLRITGTEKSYKLYLVDPEGSAVELPRTRFRCATVYCHQDRDGGTTAYATLYVTSPELSLEVPRASDGVREDPPEAWEYHDGED